MFSTNTIFEYFDLQLFESIGAKSTDTRGGGGNHLE